MFQLFHEIAALPEIKTLFTIESPLDWIGMIFFFSILYVLIVGTATMLFHQVRHVSTAIRSRRPAPARVRIYARSLIDGSCQELQQLQSVYAPSARIPLLQSICHKLKGDSTPLAASLRQQFECRLAQEQRLARADHRRPRLRGRGSAVYVSGGSGEA